MNPRYIIEVHNLGLLLLNAPNQTGIPINALTEVTPLTHKDWVVATGIGHHYSQMRNGTAIALGSKQNVVRWEQEIEEELATPNRLSPASRWWLGTRVGRSSATIFAVLAADSHYRRKAATYGEGATPRDAGDFGRCVNLLNTFPEWRGRLQEVDDAYPDTAWPKIIARWAEIEAAPPSEQYQILKACNNP